MNSNLVGIAAIGLFGASAAARGPEWVEQGDAGAQLATAQPITGSGTLSKISGALTGFSLEGAGDFEDMFLVQVLTPSSFSLQTTDAGGGGASFDTQLWVFNVDGAGLLGNDNATPNIAGTTTGSAIFQFANDGSESGIFSPGFYFICISGAGNRPVGSEGQLFFFKSPFEVSGPDGPGGAGSLSGWAPEGATGEYTIAISGSGFVPGPGGLATLAAGLTARSRRRRRD